MWTKRFLRKHKNSSGPTEIPSENEIPVLEDDDVVGSIREDGVPSTGPVIRIEKPGSGPTFKVEPNKSHPDFVRRDLAMPIMYFLLATYLVTLGTFVGARLLGRSDLFSSNDLAAAIAGISGLQGLAAAVMGFYFGTTSKDKNTKE